MSEIGGLEEICRQAVAELKEIQRRADLVEDPEAPPGKMRASFREAHLRRFRADCEACIERWIAVIAARCGSECARSAREHLSAALAEVRGNRLH